MATRASFGRRRRFGNSRMNGPVKPPKLPKAAKTIPPKSQRLVSIYKKVVSGSHSARMAAMFEALQWWDEAMVYYLSIAPLDASQMKRFELANKTRQLGVEPGGMDAERELSLRKCIELYEKVWSSHKVVSLAPYYAKYDAIKDQLDAAENILRDKFKHVLEALNQAFNAPFGVKFAIQKSDIPRQYDGAGTILLSLDLIKVLAEKAKKEGVLSVLFSEANTVVKASAVEADEHGNHALNGKKLIESVPKMLQSILGFCATVDKSKIFKSAPEEIEATVAATAVKEKKQRAANATPGTPRKSSGGAAGKVGGKYQPGSAMAILYERLLDQKAKPLSEVLNGVPTGNPMDRLKWLKKHGEANGKWSISIAGNTIQMTVT